MKSFLEKQTEIKKIKYFVSDGLKVKGKYKVLVDTIGGLEKVATKGGGTVEKQYNFATVKIFSNISYEDLVNGMVREKYTESQEFCILRKAVNGNKTEFADYNRFVELCKIRAKAFCSERGDL